MIDDVIIDILEKITVGPRDFIVLRCEEPLDKEQHDRIHRQFQPILERRKLDPASVLLLTGGLTLDTLPEDKARKLYQTLKERFDDTA